MTTSGDHIPGILRTLADDTLAASKWDIRSMRGSSMSTRGREGDIPILPPPYSVDIRAIKREGYRTFACSEQAWHPIDRACSALAHWNTYLTGRHEHDVTAFLNDARWLVMHEVALGAGMGGWPVRATPVIRAGQRTAQEVVVLSVRVQALALSALQRAYLLTGDAAFRLCAERALQTFAHDVLDGGIAVPFEDGNLVFEDVSMYPATYALRGFLLGLFSLYDYGTMCDGPEPVALAQRGHNAFHALIGAYDTGYWTRTDLLGNTLPSPDGQRECAQLLTLVATYAGCSMCQQTAKRWATYSRDPLKQVLAHIARGRRALGRALWRRAGSLLGVAPQKTTHVTKPANVNVAGSTDATTDTRAGICVPITAYPVGGGMRAVLDGWRLAMSSDWRMEFLTAHVGPDVGDRVIYRFGGDSPLFGPTTYTPFLFPNVLAYVAVGLAGLLRLLRQRPPYTVILPQDGLYSAVFAGIAAKLAGIRLVVVDHGNIHDAFDPAFYAEKREPIVRRRGLRRWLGLVRLALYVRTMRWLAHIGTRWSDHVLAASDDIARAYQQHLGVPSHHITRFPFMLDVTHYAPPDDKTSRKRLRAELNLPADAIIVAIISRLHPMKGVDTGIAAIERAYDALPPTLRERLHILIAGDGQLREQVTAQVRSTQLAELTTLWGEATADEVAMLLKVSDIFLYPARRGINSMAVLEAMGAGCATVATVTSPHIAEYLADDRGIAVSIEDVEALAGGLAMLIADDERRRDMGRRALAYVMQNHTAAAVRRYLLRTTYWVPSFPKTTEAADRLPTQVTYDERDRIQ